MTTTFGLVLLPWAVHLLDLDVHVKTNIGDRPVVVSTPTAPADVGGSSLLGPPADSAESAGIWTQFDLPDGGWGRELDSSDEIPYDSSQARAFKVRAFGLQFDLGSDEVLMGVGARISSDLKRGWLENLRTWMNARSLGHGHKINEARPPRDQMVFLRQHSGALPGYGVGQEPRAFFGGGKIALGAAPWRDALLRAGANSAPPLEYLMLDSAREAWQIWLNSRRSIIEACTATEVSLSTALGSHFTSQGLSAQEVEKELKPLRGVYDLAHRYLDENLPFPPLELEELNVRLGRPRNRAAHAAQSGSVDDVRVALETAETVLRHASPLPVLAAAPPL